jgi:hypothetical protein
VNSKSRFVDLPAGLAPPDLTVPEVCAFRRESPWTVFKKIREGVYRSYKDGRIRKVDFASVKADRERAMSAAPIGKRPPGRPRKRPEEQSTAEEAFKDRLVEEAEDGSATISEPVNPHRWPKKPRAALEAP